jgi:hypothetical protein
LFSILISESGILYGDVYQYKTMRSGSVWSTVSVVLIFGFAAGGAVVGAAGGAVGGGTGGPSGASGVAAEESGVDVTVERTGDGVRYALRLSPGADVDNAWVVVGGAAVVEATGFERTASDRRTRLTWTGAEPARVVLAVGVPRGGAADGPAGRESVATAEWAFAPVPFVELQRANDGEIERSWPLTERAGYLAGARGVYGDRYGLAGPAETVTRSANGRQVAVVVPAVASPGEDPEAIADALAAAARQFDVGDRDEAVLAYAVPGVRRGGESVPARDEFWANADSRLDTPENVWLHEYVHTRQSFRLAADMDWFREASAEYYAARLSHELGHVDRAAFRRHVAGDPSRATLTDRSTWETDAVPHDKGARVLAVLDAKIRAETNGHRSLEDAFRRLNRRDDPVTYAVFAQTVAEVAGTPMDAWLDRHVDGAAPVASQYPATARPTVAAVDPSPGLAFFLLSVGFSLAAAGPLYAVLRWLDTRERTDTARRRTRPG